MNPTKFSCASKGTGLGIFFIVFAFFLEFFAGGYEFSSEGLTKNFVENYSLWVVSMAPLVLGVAGYFIGKMQCDKRESTGMLLNCEQSRTLAIQKYLDEIATGNLDVEITEEKNEGSVYLTVDTLKNSLIKAKNEEDERKIEDSKRNWTTEGLAMFGDILRQRSSNIKEFGYLIIKNIVNYVKANQGGFYLINDENESDRHINLIAAYAYERQKYADQRIEIGDGLVGSCVFEKETIYLTDVPEEYITIKSGLGGSNPRCLILVPLKLEDEVFGVIELASFKVLEKYHIEFLEKIAESIASTISSVRIGIKTEILLKKAQEQAEQMQQQEEEMRQNMEEMHATQEESARRESEISGTLSAINSCLGVFEMDTNGKIIKSNELFESYLKNSNIVGKMHKSLVYLDDNESDFCHTAMNSILNNGSFEANISYKTENNEITTLHEYFAPIKDIYGDVNKILVIASKI